MSAARLAGADVWSFVIAHILSKRLALLPLAAMAWTASAANSTLSPQGTPQLVAMAPIIVPIVGSDRLDGALHLKLVLAAADATALARLTKRAPALRAVSVAGAIEFSRLYASTRTPVDAVRLRAALTTALRAEDAGIAEILIVEVSAVD
ncbi:hypothetical protein [Sphingomonas sp. PAMC 26621]|uniref:hypothetical protein n=1 Tax=Sphingomonas sp. PAMC 26621 TaxID=1112213 RepID=UPI000288D667|nr:hypothetical protein [Sphingomonas sp. PAMC 26621]